MVVNTPLARTAYSHRPTFPTRSRDSYADGMTPPLAASGRSDLPLIDAHNLTRDFPAADGRSTVAVLRGVSVTVNRGELIAIVGPSGSGKSTLLHCLSTLEPLDSGSLRIMGVDPVPLSQQRRALLRRAHIGFIFQSYNLLPSLSAWDNVALTLRLAHRLTSTSAVDEALASVGLTERARSLPGKLSGGEQQRVAIARVLATRPDIICADEPTGALDSATGNLVLNLLESAATGGRAVVLVTHDLQAAARADRVIIIRDGRVWRELSRSTPAEILTALGTGAGERVCGD